MPKSANILKKCATSVDFWSIFTLDERHEELSFRKGIQEPISTSTDRGALITVMKNGGLGYASTQDLSEEGIKTAYEQALVWAARFSDYSLLKRIKNPFSAHRGNYASPSQTPISKISLDEKINLLQLADRALSSHKSIVDTEASLWTIESTTTYHNSLGAEIFQEIHRVIPSLSATANSGDITQIRTLGGMRAYCRQGGFESLKSIDLATKAEEIAKDAVDLVNAENCPSESLDVLIDPDQMMLQIHESIGHPLELDRILGDERNYAGTSFVTLDMFGKYQYGSRLLNITFDPTIPEEFASYGYDDEGTVANKEFLIKDGILIRPLGGAIAQARAQVSGVANARSCSWNRPPIDRMANLNLEPGSSRFSDMLESIEHGIYLKSNASWSIDDSRNKFQFGCEWGQLIENGRLTKLVRNPNYRGISSNFWRSLKMVGDSSTVMVMGSPYCGKGEPNQCVRVGHASPVCLFEKIDVFGGE
jgi:predicted Zn-dependent protease